MLTPAQLWAKLSPVHQKEIEVAVHVFGSAFVSSLLLTYHDGGIQWTLSCIMAVILTAGSSAFRVLLAWAKVQFTNQAA